MQVSPIVPKRVLPQAGTIVPSVPMCLELFLSPPGHRGHLFCTCPSPDTPGHLSPCETTWLHAKTHTKSLSGLTTLPGSSISARCLHPRLSQHQVHTCHPETSWHLVLAGWVVTREALRQRFPSSLLPWPRSWQSPWPASLSQRGLIGLVQSHGLSVPWLLTQHVLCMRPCGPSAFSCFLKLQEKLSLCFSFLQL